VNSFKQFLILFDSRDYWVIVAFFFMMLLGSLLESLGIGLVFPFMAIVSDPEAVQENGFLRYINDTFGFSSSEDLIIFVAVFYWLILLLKNVFAIQTIKIQQNYLARKRIDLHHRFYKAYLEAPYTFHLRTNSAVLMRNIDMVGSIFQTLILPLVTIVSEATRSLAIIGILLLLETWIVLPTFAFLGLCVVVINRIFRKKLNRYGGEKVEGSAEANKAFFQGLGSVKDVQVLQRSGEFVQSYYSGINKYINAQTQNFILMQIPRLALEVLTISTIMFVMILLLLQEQSFTSILPTISLFVLAGLRLMPSLAAISSNLNLLNYNKESIDLVYKETLRLDELGSFDMQNDLKIELPPVLPFHEQIELVNVRYRYPGTDNQVVRGISLTIGRGESIAFVGPSGAGKTTMVDLFLGLLKPIEGHITVDGKNIGDNMAAWRRSIGYVPQFIYICDDSVKRNIAFGIPDELIDEDKVWQAAKVARLVDVIRDLPDGLNTLLGEHGVRLSGGQRQRVGIARALYHDPDILFLDEATSALDGETEKEVASAIERLSGEKTMIVIAHRLSTVEHCDVLYVMNEGKITDIGTYRELIEKNSQFRRMAGLAS